MEEKNIQIIILAAGKGKRMKSEEPKALAKLKGKPFIKHILETTEKLNLKTKPIIVVGYKKESIQNFLGNDYTYAIQEEQLGTGHAVRSAKDAIDPSAETILVLATDQPLVSIETLGKIIDKHKKEKPTITMATVSIPDFKDWRVGFCNFGRIIRDTKRKIEKIVESKDANEEEKAIKELNPALYAFDTKWLWKNIEKLKNNNNQAEYYLTDLIKIAFEQNQKIELVSVNDIIEAVQPNSQEELEILEKLMSDK